MKKFLILAAAAAISTLPIATPASACSGYQARDGSCGGSANESLRRDAARSRASNGYRSYDSGDTLVGAIINRGVLGNPYQSRKAKKGQTQTLPDGTTIAYRKKTDEWYVVNRPTSQPRGVYADRDTYVAN